jgi:filamentous hemagglutinin family protein
MLLLQNLGLNTHRARLVALLASTAVVAVNSAFAQSLPTNGQVTAGSASIGTQSNGSMTITQTSNSAVINWQSFNIGQGNSVTFVQPDASSAVLNRVTGTTTTTIAGQLNANGQVYLINPNGIAITSTGTVDTGAFVASTLGISNDDFMAGKRTFTGKGASAAVTNAGAITIDRGGYMALIGGSVDNTGTITVPMGKVALSSGEQATLDLSGDGFMQIAIPTKAPGKKALVSNSGRISADGGMVQLTAAAARDMARQAVNMSGTIEAKTVGGRSGDIILGGSDGEVAVSGKLDASSRKGAGGRITVTGRNIKLKGARIDASGESGGGSVKIGGGRQGKGTLQRAKTLSVDATSVIKADANSVGNGGDVVLWSDDLTSFAGMISAKGGSVSGNGGEVEVSGSALLSYSGFTDLTAAHGSFGNLLLDPYNVTISTGTANNAAGFTATGNDSVINAATLQSALSGANVTVSTGASGSQAGNITVAAPLSWSAPTTLSLNAAGAIAINAPISLGGVAGAGLNLNATSGVAINAPITVKGAGAVALTYNSSSPANLSFGLANNGFAGSLTYRDASGNALSTAPGNQGLTINGNAYTLVYSMADLDAIDGVSAVTGASVTAYGPGLTGKYALAGNLNAAGTTYTAGLIAGGTTQGNTQADPHYPAAFSGVLEGLGHTVSNLTIADAGNNYVGLIGYTTGAVQNVGLAGGSVAGRSFVGGLAGTNAGTITQSYSSVSIASIVAGGNAGGLVGVNDTTGTITRSYATGAVTGKNSFGGLVGQNNGSISQSYATGALTGATTGMGDSYNGGGLVGYNNKGSISQSYATGAVSSSSYGYNYGGLVGFNDGSGTIAQSYATGSVSATLGNYYGGLVGTMLSGTVSSSYWDTLTSGMSNGIGRNDASAVGATGLTTAQMQDLSSFASTYAGWDFNSVWAPPNRVGQNNNSATAYYPQLYALSRVVTVAPSPATTVYGDGAPALLAQYYGLRAGDFITSQATLGAILTTTPVGTYMVSASGASASNAAYRFVYLPGQVTVTPRPLSLSGSRIYNGSNGLDASIFTLSNLANGETLTLSGTGTMADKNAGSGKSVSLGTLALGNGNGGVASNYTLSGGTYTVDVAKATLTLTGVTANNKVYDGTTAVTISNGGSLSGVFLNDSVSFNSSGASFADRNAGTAKTVNIGGLTLSGADAGNYTIASTATTTADIAKASLTLTGITADNKVYDGTTAVTISNGGSLSGVFFNDAVSFSSSGASFADKNAGAAKTVNVVGLTLSGTDAGNYTIASSVTTTAEIARAQITSITGITANNKTYDGTSSATLNFGQAVLGGVFANDNLSVGSASGAFSDKNAGTGKTVTISGITLGGADAGNYTVSLEASTVADIARARIISISGITANNRTYDGTRTATLDTSGASFAGMVDNDILTVGNATGAFIDKNAGAGKTVNIGGLTLSGADAANYTLVSTTAITTADIAKAVISSVDGVTAANKTYDGTTNATLLTGGAIFNGMVSNDVLTVGSATGAFTDKNAASGKTVNISGLTLGGTDAGNYTLANGTATTSADIAKAQITAITGIVAGNKTYDSTTVATLDTSGASFAGMVENDILTVGNATGAFTDKNAGTGKTVNIGGLTLSGADASNYTLVATTATATADIAKAQIIAITGITAGNRVYDGTTMATLNVDGAEFEGIVLGDNLTVGSSSGAFTDKNAGAGKTVNISGLSLGGTDAGNYTLASTTATATADIARAQITSIAGITAYGRIYDGTSNATLDASNARFVGKVDNDDLTVGNATGSFSDKNAATGKTVSIADLTLSGADAANYTLASTTATTSADIAKAQITAVSGITASSKTYDGTRTATLDTSGASFAGMVENDVLTVGGATGAFTDKNAGTGKTVNIGDLTLSGADASNYTLASTTATTTADIAKAVISSIDGIAASNRTYDGTTNATLHTGAAIFNGMVANDILTVADAAGAFSDKNVGTAKTVNISGLSLGGTDAGNYTLATSTATSSADITTATLTLAGFTASNKTYDGTTGAQISNAGNLSGVFLDDAVSFGYSGASFADKDAGSDKIVTLSGITLAGADAGNYTIAATAATTADIARRALTVEADSLAKTYGDAVPALSYSVSGLVNDDVLAGALATVAGQYSGVGAYAITQGTLGNANYAISFTGAELTVNPRDITVTATPASRGFGVANPPLGWTVGGAGLVNGDTLSGSLATTATNLSAPGNYAITQGSLTASANYTMSFVPSVLTVEQALTPPPGTSASAVAPTFNVDRFGPANAMISGATELADGSRTLIADPRFDGTMVCAVSGDATTCVQGPQTMQ